jgi:hypothetical protein
LFKYSWREENNLLIPSSRLNSDTLIKIKIKNPMERWCFPEWKSDNIWPILFEIYTFQHGIKYWKCICKSCTIRVRENNGVFGEYLSFKMNAVRIEH